MKNQVEPTTLKRYLLPVLVILCLGIFDGVMASIASAEEEINERLEILEGGRLYDVWWKEQRGAEEPKTKNPLWTLRVSKGQSNGDTWRCVECHGWDYRGSEGAAGSGSQTPWGPGILKSNALSIEQLMAILKGGTNPGHDFSAHLNDESLRKLAYFVTKGTVDLQKYIDYGSKAPLSANAKKGEKIYIVTKCAFCHGSDGVQVADDKSDYLGALAKNKPFEFLHKTRFGEPGESMQGLKVRLEPEPERDRFSSRSGYDMQDLMDLLGFCRTLPVK